jgi:hypothetical protein
VARTLLWLLAIWISSVAPVHAQLPLPLAQPSLDLRAAAQGRVAVATPDGGAIVAHDGRFVGGDTERPLLVRFRADGTVDPNWRVQPSGSVTAIAIEGDDVFLGGFFAAVDGAARRGLAKVSLSTGALSPWDPNSGSTSSYRFGAFVVIGNALYVGGFFTQIGTTPRTLVAKADRNSGAVDSAFSVSVTGQFSSEVALATDGAALFVGGSFSAVNGVSRSLQQTDC